MLNEYTRECVAIHVTRPISSRQVIHLLERLFLLRGGPSYVRIDNGPVFIAFAAQQWLHDRRCNTRYVTPGSPWENPFTEGFSGTLCAEVLNCWVFAERREVQTIIKQWRQEYNHHCPTAA